MEQVELVRLPSQADVFGRRLVRARLSPRSRGPVHESFPLKLPSVQLNYRPRKANPRRLDEYNELIGTTGLTAPFVHVMATPVVGALITREDFPLPAQSMFHLANTITQHRPIDASEALSFRVHAKNPLPHDAGVQVEIHSEAWSGEECVWSEVASYVCTAVLLPGSGGLSLHQFQRTADAPPPPETEPPLTCEPVATWKLPADAGRTYAAISGQRSAVHTSSLAAKGFGFKRAIAHGMETAARAFTLLNPPDAFEWETSFVRPVLLPSTVDIQTWVTGNTQGYRGADAKTNETTFVGTVTSK
mgnify:CR=1 FL=1|jgi:acyl dehydratase